MIVNTAKPVFWRKWLLMKLRTIIMPGFSSQTFVTRTRRFWWGCAQEIPGRQSKMFSECKAKPFLLGFRKQICNDKQQSKHWKVSWFLLKFDAVQIIPHVRACKVMFNRISSVCVRGDYFVSSLTSLFFWFLAVNPIICLH